MLSTIAKLRWPVKAALGALIIGPILYVVSGTDTSAPQGTPRAAEGGFIARALNALPGGDDTLKVCTNTWGGFAGGQWYNGGFEPSEQSQFTRNYGIRVQFIKSDDFDVSRAAFNSGECDLVWGTVDSFVTEAEALGPSQPRSAFQVDWSRGGDSVIAVRGINRINDLKGRTIGVAYGTPSHSLLLWLLNTGGLSPRELNIQQMKDALTVAAAFKAGQLDAGVVWSPDDVDAISGVPGSSIVVSTKQATDIIADHLLVRQATLDEKRDALVALYKGWMQGNASVSAAASGGGTAFNEAVAITAAGYGMPAEFMEVAIRNTRLTTHGDNLNFYGLNPSYRGVKAEALYARTGMLYQEQGFIGGFPSWRSVVDVSIIQAAEADTAFARAGSQVAENTPTFKPPTPEIVTAQAVAAKPVTVNFETGSALLDDADKDIIDRNVLTLAQQFRTSYIRVEGNTDSTGNININTALSRQRAQSVAQYLVTEHGIPSERLVTVGNGPAKPVCDEGIGGEACRAQNRRTEFQILQTGN